MPTIVGILTFISMINSTSERLKARNFICQYFSFYQPLKFCAQLSWAWKKFYNLRAKLLQPVGWDIKLLPHLYMNVDVGGSQKDWLEISFCMLPDKSNWKLFFLLINLPLKHIVGKKKNRLDETTSFYLIDG